MEASDKVISKKRYASVSEEKAVGSTYTPKVLSDFVSKKIVEVAKNKLPNDRTIRVLDPAIGHGELLLSLLDELFGVRNFNVEVYGFETDSNAIDVARNRISDSFPGVSLIFRNENFLEFVVENFGCDSHGSLFLQSVPEAYDIIIANPPYVRTQVMGSEQAKIISDQFGISGRVDLYYAFVLGMSQVLKPKGVAGIIVSNRFMTTKSGAFVRKAVLDNFNMRHVWDLGDTKIFDAAVLPAVLLVEGRNAEEVKSPGFTSIYQTNDPVGSFSKDPIDSLLFEGVVEVPDGRRFNVQHGKLNTNGKDDGVWRIATDTVDAWLEEVEARSWGKFRDIGKIRVGVKTCADKVFIRKDWCDIPVEERPELLRPLTTHKIARRFKPESSDKPRYILYPHETVQGRRRAVDLNLYPLSKAYLDENRSKLEGRKYVIEGGRNWYEIWVPQDPSAWGEPKLVFRDISEEPTFWIDLDGSVVNGDCYWLVSDGSKSEDVLWLAVAVGNSTFIEKFYDLRFNNKLYAGRRRFITQYVEEFPLPDPSSNLGKSIIDKAKEIYECTPSSEGEDLYKEMDAMVWESLTGAHP